MTIKFAPPDQGTQTTETPSGGFSFTIKKTLLSAQQAVLSETTLVNVEGLQVANDFVFTLDDWPLDRSDLPWTEPPPSLTAADQAFIRSVITTFKLALEQKDIASLKNLYNFKNSIMAKSMGMSIEEMEDEQTSFFNVAFGAVTYTVICADLNALKYAVAPDANLVAVSTANDDTPLKVDVGDDTKMNLSFVFSRIASSTWVLVE